MNARTMLELIGIAIAMFVLYLSAATAIRILT